MSFLADNWVLHLIAFVVILLLCIPTFFLDRIAARFASHQPIKPESIQSATFIRAGHEERPLTDDEVNKIVKEYNKLVFIMKRTRPVTDAAPSSISIVLQSGERVDILLSGDDLDIVRTTSNKTIVFWAKQDELKTFLSTSLKAMEG